MVLYFLFPCKGWTFTQAAEERSLIFHGSIALRLQLVGFHFQFLPGRLVRGLTPGTSLSCLIRHVRSVLRLRSLSVPPSLETPHQTCFPPSPFPSLQVPPLPPLVLHQVPHQVQHQHLLVLLRGSVALPRQPLHLRLPSPVLCLVHPSVPGGVNPILSETPTPWSYPSCFRGPLLPALQSVAVCLWQECAPVILGPISRFHVFSQAYLCGLWGSPLCPPWSSGRGSSSWDFNVSTCHVGDIGTPAGCPASGSWA